MKFEPIPFKIQGDMEDCLPPMIRVRQNFSGRRIRDVERETLDTLRRLPLENIEDKRIAITAGSRRIANLPEILRILGGFLCSRGARPFIVPAMGSHGEATADGQAEVLKQLGITEESTGMEIISDMETVCLGITDGGCRIYCGKTAAEADGIVVCGRIKPHTSISGIIESGLCKMMVVGLGKHKGAAEFHRQGYSSLAEILPEGGRLFLRKAPVLFGLGIVENACDETMEIEAMMPGRLLEREAALLQLARRNMPRFLVDEIDVLIVDQLGKDISGGGMDPNITGRAITPLPRFPTVPVHCIVVLGITVPSHGNANGIGAADLTTCRVAESINFNAMYTNILTSGAYMAAKLPVILKDDETAIRAAACCTPKRGKKYVKMVHIRDTLHLSEIEISDNYLEEIKNEARIEVLSAPEQLKFDGEGRIVSFVK
ncbi:lactate racemase domain-containing protein [uncultured Clostridium sp.]|uniref:lactate racemase domain-containing protein n=1 Tax=uncultured Clostridium sp. TaxID=59620 RepID=UPI0025DDA7ED|nr:lactate racemase domain-containing protein [uncultured Clostridium sp.]